MGMSAVELVAKQAPELLSGVYSTLFNHRASTLAVERVVHVKLEDLGAGISVKVDRGDSGQRFVFHAESNEVLSGFGVVPDGDPRAGVFGTANEPTLVSREDLKTGRLIPCSHSDAGEMTKRLVARHKLYREMDAASVINTGRTYHAEIGGDGVSLFSPNHPHEHGMWSNTTGKPFSRAALIDACEGIRQFVAYDGRRIVAKASSLVIAPDLEDAAQDAVKNKGDPLAPATWLPYFVWPQLNPGTWFVLTDVKGLLWFERAPLEIETCRDHGRDMQVVKGYERRCFTYVDPRAVHN